MGKDIEFYIGKSEVIEMGGKGSGHRGHKGGYGGKGRKGGSLPTKGLSSRVHIVGGEEFIEKHFPGISRDEVLGAFILPNTTATIRFIPDGMEVNWVEGGENKYIGHCERLFSTDKDGKRVWDAHFIQFSKSHQNKGAADSLYHRQVELARKAGFDRMEVYANISIGRYAWAKQGYEYHDPARAATSTERFKSWCAKYDIPEPKGGWPVFKSVRDVANYKGDKTMKGSRISNSDVPKDMDLHLGKAFMLDDGHGAHDNWHGVMKL